MAGAFARVGTCADRRALRHTRAAWHRACPDDADRRVNQHGRARGDNLASVPDAALWLSAGQGRVGVRWASHARDGTGGSPMSLGARPPDRRGRGRLRRAARRPRLEPAARAPGVELTLVDQYDYHQEMSEVPRVAGGTRAAAPSASRWTTTRAGRLHGNANQRLRPGRPAAEYRGWTHRLHPPMLALGSPPRLRHPRPRSARHSPYPDRRRRARVGGGQPSCCHGRDCRRSRPAAAPGYRGLGRGGATGGAGWRVGRDAASWPAAIAWRPTAQS